MIADTQLMLGEIVQEAGQPQEAVAYFEPLMEGLDAEKAKAYDLKTLLRIYVAPSKPTWLPATWPKPAPSASDWARWHRTTPW